MPDKYVPPVGVAGVARNGDALNYRGRVAFQNAPVVERAGVALLAVAEDVLVRVGIAGQKPPLDARGKGGAPAPPQAGSPHFAQSRLRRHLGKRLVQRGVAPVGDVLVKVGGVNVARVPQGNALLLRPHRVVVQMGNACRRRRAVPQVADSVFRQRNPAANMPRHYALRHFRGNIPVKHPGAAGRLHIQQRFGETETQRAHLGYAGRHILPPQGVLDGGHHLKTAGRLAGQPGADAYPGAVAGGKLLPAPPGFGADFGVAGGLLRSHRATALLRMKARQAAVGQRDVRRMRTERVRCGFSGRAQRRPGRRRFGPGRRRA